jgi:DNA-directed RNA polymerase specialized sigma24 family protein
MDAIDSKKLEARDEAALRELFDSLYPRLVAYSRAISRSAHTEVDANDIAQETLLTIYRNLDRFLEKQPGRTLDKAAASRWAYIVARKWRGRYVSP